MIYWICWILWSSFRKLNRSGRVVYRPCFLCAAWTVMGSSLEPAPMLVDMSAHVCGSKKLDCHADLYTVSRCHTRGESQEFIACRRQSTQARDRPWLWNPGETSPEVQNRGISGPTKRTYVLQKIILKSSFRKNPISFLHTHVSSLASRASVTFLM